jgi:hypothetical protein
MTVSGDAARRDEIRARRTPGPRSAREPQRLPPAADLPSRRLVAARRAQQEHPAVLELQHIRVAVKAAERALQPGQESHQSSAGGLFFRGGKHCGT